MEQLRRVQHDCRETPSREFGDRRITGVVRAPHPGEDRGPACGGPDERLELPALRDERLRRASEGVGLTGDAGDEWVRKLS